MATGTLTSTTIASRYKSLLKLLGTANDVLAADASAKYIEDGDGNNSVLSLSTTRVGIGNTAPDSLLEIQQGSSGGLVALKVDNDDTDKVAVSIEAANIDADVMDISADAVTTANVIDITADALTTGSAAIFATTSTALASTATGGMVEIISSGDTDTNVNNLLFIKNDHDDSANTIPLFIDQDANNRAISIDSEATTYEVIKISAPATTTGSVIGIDDANSLTSGSILKLATSSTGLSTTVSGGMVEIMSTGNSSTNVNNLLFIKNDDASATGTIGMYVQQDSTGPAISATGGIVEQGGTLKENLFPNSGFDVWSNSTLVNVGSVIADDDAGDDETSDWTVDSSAALAFDSDHYEFTSSAAGRHIELTSLSLTAGKLYRVSANMKDGTGAPTDVRLFIDDGAQRFAAGYINTTGSFVVYTAVIEATTTTGSGKAGLDITTSLSGGNMEFKDFTLYEVTPGCEVVSGGAGVEDLAFDGWSKSTEAKMWRQEHIDVGHASNTTNSKEGSFYALKLYGGNHSYQAIVKYNTVDAISRLRGRTVTIGAWCKSSVTGEGGVSFDNSGAITTSMTTGTSWEWIEMTVDCSASGTYLYPGLHVLNTKTAYFSQPMLVFGSSIGEGNYTRPQGEIFYFTHKSGGEHSLNNFSGTQDYSSAQQVNTESESNGMVPKGVRAVLVRLQAQSSTVPTLVELTQSSGLNTHYTMLTQVSNQAASLTGWMTCDVNGDFDIAFQNATDNVLIAVQGVHLQ